MDSFTNLFFLFYIYSIIGWIIETIYVSIKQHKLANRGFLVGPYCPIYGLSSILMLIFLSKYKEDLLVLFIMGMFIPSLLEYITSFILEKLFKVRWWDYSDKMFNIDGRVCLQNSFIFGILCILLILYINPFINHLINLIPHNLLNPIILMFMILFIIDSVFSLITIFKVKTTIKKINGKKDYTQEVSDKVRKSLTDQSKLIKRLFNAFPNVNIRFK